MLKFYSRSAVNSNIKHFDFSSGKNPLQKFLTKVGWLLIFISENSKNYKPYFLGWFLINRKQKKKLKKIIRCETRPRFFTLRFANDIWKNNFFIVILYNVWCGGALETHWATCLNKVTPRKTKEFLKFSCFFRFKW